MENTAVEPAEPDNSRTTVEITAVEPAEPDNSRTTVVEPSEIESKLSAVVFVGGHGKERLMR